MNTAIGILSIVVAFALLIVLSYKGMSVMYVAPLCALFVALVNGIPLLDAISGPFIGGTTGFISGLLPIFLLSILIGRICAQRFRAPKADHCRLHLHCCELGDVFWRN